MRSDFEDEVARLFVQQYGAEIAALNANGSKGIKNIFDVLGKSICKEIDKEAAKAGIENCCKKLESAAKLNKIKEKKIIGDWKAVLGFKNPMKSLEKKSKELENSAESKKTVNQEGRFTTDTSGVVKDVLSPGQPPVSFHATSPSQNSITDFMQKRKEDSEKSEKRRHKP